MGSLFYGKNKVRDALYLYDNALMCCPSDEIDLKRDLSSNVSLMNFRLENFNKAKISAEDCIKLDPSWYKVSSSLYKSL